MASSDVVVTNAKPGIQGSDQWARRCLAVALVAPWWLPLIGHASASFYKELLELLLIGFAGVLIAWPAERSDARLRIASIASDHDDSGSRGGHPKRHF